MSLCLDCGSEDGTHYQGCAAFRGSSTPRVMHVVQQSAPCGCYVGIWHGVMPPPTCPAHTPARLSDDLYEVLP